MSGTSVFYDRVKITLFGSDYLSNGYILDFSANQNLNAKLTQGMSAQGYATGAVFGNQATQLRWTEYLVQATDFIDLASLINLGSSGLTGQIVVQPFSINGAATAAPSFVGSIILADSLNITAGGEGTEMKRDVSLQVGQWTPLI